MNVPICKPCIYLDITSFARTTSRNSHLKGPRGNCVCRHPAAVDTFKKVCPKSPRMAGFIGFTDPGEYAPQIKTSPKWCPLRHQVDGGEGQA